MNKLVRNIYAYSFMYAFLVYCVVVKITRVDESNILSEVVSGSTPTKRKTLPPNKSEPRNLHPCNFCGSYFGGHGYLNAFNNNTKTAATFQSFNSSQMSMSMPFKQIV